MKKKYIGDDVYVELDEDGAFILTVEQHGEVLDQIGLFPNVWTELEAYIKQAKEPDEKVTEAADTDKPTD